MIPIALIPVPVFALGAAAGFLMHRSGFCLAGSFRDIFLFRSGFMARNLLLAVVASMLLFEGARQLGLLPFYPFPMLGSPSVSHLVGGGIFGVGMVLAGGCVVGVLYRMGAGGLVAGTAFLGLLAGSAAYAEIHPAWTAVRVAGTLSRGWSTIPQGLGVDPVIVVLAVAVPSIALFLRWRADGSWSRRGVLPRGHVPMWAAAIGLSVLGTANYLLSGMPIGITTSYAKMAGWIESGLAPDHFAALDFFRSVPLNVTSPAGEVLRGGPAPVLDAVAAIQLPLIAGVVLGSALSAVLLSEFRVHRGVPPMQLLAGFAGGMLMGLASRMGSGCNVWHLLGGVPVLAVPSLLFAAGLFPGAWAGTLLLRKIV
ncbi:MAG: YeeE/YedE family protein [bacterium]|nr:YeeE/YedE family protein [bacterium]